MNYTPYFFSHRLFIQALPPSKKIPLPTFRISQPDPGVKKPFFFIRYPQGSCSRQNEIFIEIDREFPLSQGGKGEGILGSQISFKIYYLIIRNDCSVTQLLLCYPAGKNPPRRGRQKNPEASVFSFMCFPICHPKSRDRGYGISHV